jgi:hypothetical protein
MVIDVWDGLCGYSSDDAEHWRRQPTNLLQRPGKNPTDRSKGQHSDVIVSGGRAFMFYFVHQVGLDAQHGVPNPERRTVQLMCDRDAPTHVLLLPGEENVF